MIILGSLLRLTLVSKLTKVYGISRSLRPLSHQCPLAREEEERVQDRFASTLVIAAAIIAAIRLAREDDVSRHSPRVTFATG